jgi:L-2-hydroxyglutarate oxidase
VIDVTQFLANRPMTPSADVTVIGAGIVGLSIALEILKRFPEVSLVILEKESRIAFHQTGHNSGVVHSGIYYKPGSLKSRLCVQGSAELLDFCREHDVPIEKCGKVIVATSTDEIPRLHELFGRGLGNGLKGLRMLSSEQIREIEPHAAGILGIHVPGTAIVDFRRVAEKYGELIVEHGGVLSFNTEVTGLHRSADAIAVETSAGVFASGLVINCAGLQSDRVRHMADPERDLTIVPFRGEYYELAPEKQNLVKGLIYPVPDPQFPFLGVHLTRRIGAGVEAGPNAVLALKREGYSKTSFAFGDVAEFASFGGFWRMASRHWRMSLGEYYRSWSKAAFVRALQRLLPALTIDDLAQGGAGVRAQALDRHGKLVDDFHIVFRPRMVNVCNVPSPAATASLAIARYIVDRLVKEMPEAIPKRM